MDEAVGVHKHEKGSSSLPSPTTSKTWVLPFLPISMNKLYGINYRTKSVYMMNDARNFKNKCKLCIGNFPVEPEDRLRFSIEVHTDWFFKNGRVKKADIHNLIKVVVDSVSERLGFDDSQVFSFSANKIQSTENYCTVTLEKLS